MTLDDRQESNSELDWQAFRYVASEMTELETTAFELQLAEDQLAREAVARAMELTETVSACHFDLGDQAIAAEVELSSRARRIGWWSAGVWASLGAAASLLLVLALQGVWKNDSPLAGAYPSEFEMRNDSTGELAEAWSETREPQDQDDEEFTASVLLEARDDTDLSESDAVLLELLNVVDDDLTAPDWMLAALEDLPGDEAASSEGIQTP